MWGTKAKSTTPPKPKEGLNGAPGWGVVPARRGECAEFALAEGEAVAARVEGGVGVGEGVLESREVILMRPAVEGEKARGGWVRRLAELEKFGAEVAGGAGEELRPLALR